MVCRTCQEKQAGDGGEVSRRERRKSAAPPSPPPAKSDRRVRDQLCSRCGRLVGPEDTARRVRAKQSQLARFGLTGSRSPLLERKRKEDR